MDVLSTITQTTHTVFISTKNKKYYHRQIPSKLLFPATKQQQQQRWFIIRSSTESETSTTSTTDDEAIETPERADSLISALNVERALRGLAITDVDHYGRLDLQRGCSYEQVTTAYRNKTEELANEELDEEQLEEKRKALQESYSILSSVEERRLYDWSLSRSETPDDYVWPFQVDITQTPTQLPPPPEPEDVGPTRVVGYVFLAWIILSFVLSAALNR